MVIPRNGLEACVVYLGRARAEHPRRSDGESPVSCPGPFALDTADAKKLVRGLADLRARGVEFGSSEHAFPPPEALAAVQNTPGLARFAVVVRDPVDRTASSYRFHGGRGGRCAGPCEDAADFGKAEADLTTRMLLGRPFGPIALRQPPEALWADAAWVRARANATLPAALAALARFDVVVPFERLDDADTPRVLAAALGWAATPPMPRVRPKEPKAPRAPPPPVTAAHREALERMNTLDRAVHGAALRRFAADAAALPPP